MVRSSVASERRGAERKIILFDREKLAKYQEKGGEFGKRGKNGKMRKSQEEKAKIGKVLSLYPSWLRYL